MTDNTVVFTMHADVGGKVGHIAPCVPECPICHPETASDEDFKLFGIERAS
jgi:hypothetical protein